jgi:eukaryotic-like serine/threonine-protein kinase
VNVQPGQILAQRFAIEKLIGEGGMGKVYRARHTRLNKTVAIKALLVQNGTPKEAQERVIQFENEAQILAGLSHPALVQVLDFFEHDGTHYLVMEFVEGKTLNDVVRLAPKPISERRVLQWADETLDVLEYLHTQKPPVILKDLKPDNVMLTETGKLKVIDFGIAKRLTASGGTMDIAKGVGTEEYAPLEQYGQGSTDQRSDLYSLGAMLYFLLTKQSPMPAWQRATTGDPLPDASQYNPTVSSNTAKALQCLTGLFPQDRPPDVAAARKLFGTKTGTGYQLSGSQTPENRTELKQPPTGKSRVLKVELLRRHDLAAPIPGPATRFVWSPHTQMLWLGKKGLRRFSFPGPQAVPTWPSDIEVYSMALSPADRWLALSSSRANQLTLWDPTSGRPGPVIQNRTGIWPDKIGELRFGMGHRLLFGLSEALQLSSYDLESKQKHLVYRPHNSWLSILDSRLRSFDVSADQVAAGATDGHLFVWDLASAKLLWQVRQAGSIVATAFSPDTHFLAIATDQGAWTVFRSETGQQLRLTPTPSPLTALAWSSDGRVVATGDQAGYLRFWDLANGQESLRLQLPQANAAVSEIAWSSQRQLAVSWADNTLKVLSFDW